MSSPLERRGSAHFEVVDAADRARYEGVQMSIRALRAKAAERREGVLGTFSISADYLEKSLEATVGATPP